jgi:hypothetical protein
MKQQTWMAEITMVAAAVVVLTVAAANGPKAPTPNFVSGEAHDALAASRVRQEKAEAFLKKLAADRKITGGLPLAAQEKTKDGWAYAWGAKKDDKNPVAVTNRSHDAQGPGALTDGEFTLAIYVEVADSAPKAEKSYKEYARELESPVELEDVGGPAVMSKYKPSKVPDGCSVYLQKANVVVYINAPTRRKGEYLVRAIANRIEDEGL